MNFAASSPSLTFTAFQVQRSRDLTKWSPARRREFPTGPVLSVAPARCSVPKRSPCGRRAGLASRRARETRAVSNRLSAGPVPISVRSAAAVHAAADRIGGSRTAAADGSDGHEFSCETTVRCAVRLTHKIAGDIRQSPERMQILSSFQDLR